MKKSDNNYILRLEVKDYKLVFDKDKTDYELIIKDGINKLNIDLMLESEKSSYEIIGDDDLLENDYKVLIKVKAENGDIRTYTINTKVEETENVQDLVDVELKDENRDEKINRKHLFIIGGVIVAIILIVIMIISLITYNSNKKINKMLSENDAL